MPRVTLESPHSLGQEEATRRLKEKFSFVKDAYGDKLTDLHEQWSGNTLTFGFKAAGMKVAGTVTVGQSQVSLEAKVPLAAMMFKGMIQKKVSEQLGDLLTPAGGPPSPKCR
ncbi:MAG: hypothetical protein A2V70_09775 [Planctomycetes bacterium RBG_13_63_9]|nr:MAG: hypothetical protein A2V70_09775 [Planctomycetes bacterium RBG_13_63_9]